MNSKDAISDITNSDSTETLFCEDDLLLSTMSFRALKKAMRIVEDMVFYYFPLHNLSFKDFFDLIPAMLFSEAIAYQNDEEYEVMLDNPQSSSPRLDILKRTLIYLNLYDEDLNTELQRGIEYWKMERKFLSGYDFNEIEITESLQYRCCDYRFLHRLLFRLLNKSYDDELLELNWLAEQIGEIEDDLLQYENDVLNNVYNIYSLFVKLYGVDDASQQLQNYLDRLNDRLKQNEIQLAATRPELSKIWEEIQNAFYTANPSPDIPQFPATVTVNNSEPITINSRVNLLEIKPSFSYKALAKSLVIVKEIITYYFPLHGLTEKDAFSWMTELIFAEAILYQMDEEYEQQVNNPNFASSHAEILCEILKSRNLYDSALASELECGFKLWKLEQQMCSGGTFKEADIVDAMYYKCGDYRFLHRLLFLLTNRPYNEPLIALCSLLEERGEIEDDLRHYHSDIQRNVYNSYRMLVRLYGKTAPEQLQEHLNSLDFKIDHQVNLLQETNPEWVILGQSMQQAYYQEHPTPAIPEPILEF